LPRQRLIQRGKTEQEREPFNIQEMVVPFSRGADSKRKGESTTLTLQ
jgi:hypothetical protein